MRTNCAGCEEPANDSPTRDDVRTQHFVGGVDDSTDVANEITAQGLALWGRQILQPTKYTVRGTGYTLGMGETNVVYDQENGQSTGCN